MKGRIKILLIFFVMANYTFAQQRITIKSVENNKLVSHQEIEFMGKLEDKNTDIFLFPKWSNQSKLFIGNEVYLMSNINFNITNNRLYSRVGRDKYFKYKSYSVDAISINNHLFKRVGNSFFEVLNENNKKLFLKKYEIEIQRIEPARIGGASHGSTKTKIVYKYFVDTKDELKSITLKKKSILGSFDIEKDVVETFVKKENLSYKNESDVVKIIEFIMQTSDEFI